MKEDNVKIQMRKGIMDYCVLAILANGDEYAPAIIDKLKGAEMIVVEGTLYPLLNRLLKEKVLKYEWQESTQGPPRKYYSLTMDGEEALRQLNQSWNELSNTVAKLNEQ